MATRFIQNYIQELLNEHIPPGWSPPGGGGNSGRPVGVAEPGRGGAPVDRLYRVADRDRDRFDRLGPIHVQDKQHIRPGIPGGPQQNALGRSDRPVGPVQNALGRSDRPMEPPQKRGMPSPMPGGGARPGGPENRPMPSPMPGGGARPGPSIEQEMLNRRRGQQRRVQGQQYPPPVQSGRTPVERPPRTTSGGGPDPYDRILYGRGNDPSRDRRNMVDELRAQDERYKRRGKDPNVRELRRGGLEAGLSSAERNRPGAYGDPTRGGGALPSWYNEQYVAEYYEQSGGENPMSGRPNTVYKGDHSDLDPRELRSMHDNHVNEIQHHFGTPDMSSTFKSFQSHVNKGIRAGHDTDTIIDNHPIGDAMQKHSYIYRAQPHYEGYIDTARALHGMT